MSPEKQARIERLQKGTERNCSDQRRRDTLEFIEETLRVIRHHDEINTAQAERIKGLRQALDDRNKMMDAANEEQRDLLVENQNLRVAVLRQAVELSEVRP